MLSWKVPYGYRRLPRTTERAAHLVVHEPEAAVARRIFDDYVAGRYSIRAITIALNRDHVPTPTGKPAWPTSTVARILGNETYVGRLYYNQTDMVSGPGRRGKRQVPRPREEWILIPVPALITEDVFDASAAPGPLSRGLQTSTTTDIRSNTAHARGVVALAIQSPSIHRLFTFGYRQSFRKHIVVREEQ